MISYSNKNAFMLATVLMVLLLLSIISIGVLFLSSTGIQRTTLYQDSGIAYINAMSGVNMVSSFFNTVQRIPDWQDDQIFDALPSELQAPFPINDASNNLLGEFEVVSMERFRDSSGNSTRNRVPQDFEVHIVGRALDDRGNMGNDVHMRMRVRVEADAFTRWVYFLNSHPADIWWTPTHSTRGQGTRLHGPVHFNERTNIFSRQSGWELDAQDPIFVSWDYGRTVNLSIVGSGNLNSSFRWNNWVLDPWNPDPRFREFAWGDAANPNRGWFGVAGHIDTEDDITYGGFNLINTNAEYVPFPTRDESNAVRNMIYNGDPEQRPSNLFQEGDQPVDTHNPEWVQIPNSSRPNGGIFINKDVSIHFEALPVQVGGTEEDPVYMTDPNGNTVYNNHIIIEQPPPRQANANQKSAYLFRWTIDVERDNFGQPTRMTRRFYRLKFNSDDEIEEIEPRPVFRNDDTTFEEVYEGPFNNEGLGIYVDGNIGWIDRAWNDKVWLDSLGKGLTMSDLNANTRRDYLVNRRIKGLSGETYGRITIFAQNDIAITDNFTFAEYQIPMSPDFQPEDFAQVNYVNGIVARNIAIVPFFFDPARPGENIEDFDTPFYVDAGILTTGLAGATGNQPRSYGSMGQIQFIKQFGGDNHQHVNWHAPGTFFNDRSKGRFILRGSYAANTRTPFGYTSGDGMRHSWYYDLRFRIMTPGFFPQAGLRNRIFELSRIN